MKIFPIIVKKITQVIGGSGTATASWTDTEDLADPILGILTVGSDTETASDLGNNLLVMISDIEQESDLVSENMTADFPDTEDDADSLHVVGLAYPDEGDTWLDQASAGTAHGSATTLLAKGASVAPGSDERRAYFMFDLTKFAGLVGDTGATNGAVLKIFASTSNGLTATTLTLTFRSGTTAPFVESTATWTNSSASLAAYGSLRVTTTKSIATGAAALYSIGISAAQISSILADGWLLITCTTAGGAVPDTVTINSKENASNTPVLTLSLSSP